MKMADREYVDGTEPRVYIGHRTRKLANGAFYTSKIWHAEYSLNSRQNSKSLETTVRSVAIRMPPNVRPLCFVNKQFGIQAANVRVIIV